MSTPAEKELNIFDYIPKVLPLLDLMFIVWIAICSPQPWITTPINIAIPIVGLTTIHFLKNKGRWGFYGIGVLTSVPNFILNYWASPECPTWLNQFALIAGGLLMARSLADQLVVLSLALLCTIVPIALSDNSPTLIVSAITAELALFFLLERSIKFMHAQKNVLERQKKVIEEKNKDIMDSITYAKRIQQAKLPQLHEIHAAFQQCFVLFKPKDIVSGDFYFFRKADNISFIAAADCTGHGVPGALMSMVGSEQLEDAILQSTSPSEILTHLNRGLKTSLRQNTSDDSTRDGMDIALCTFDSGILKYAGANRPLWLIRKDSGVLEEIKATKKAIGGLTEDHQQFDLHELSMNSGDTVYICTDGYADTFNGIDGKKLTTKRLKQILVEIQRKSMADQQLHLDHFIEQWKGNTEQIDDILVIGIRF